MVGGVAGSSVVQGDENHPFYIGQKLNQTFKALIISILGNVSVVDMWSLPTWQQYGCLGLSDVAAMIFVGSEIADLILSGYYGFLQKIDVAHHIVYIFLAVSMRFNSGPSFIGALLLAQETSGIFLNYFLLMRNRTPNHWSVKLSFVLFALCFFIWRLGLGTFATLHYLTHAKDALDEQYPTTQARLIGVSLVAGSTVQWYWGREIANGIRHKLSPNKRD